MDSVADSGPGLRAVYKPDPQHGVTENNEFMILSLIERLRSGNEPK